MTRIKGHVYGMLPGGFRRIRFRILEIISSDEEEKEKEMEKIDEIALDPDSNIPTMSPWVLFDLNVEKMKDTTFYYVTRIYSCSKIFLVMKKNAIIDYYQNAIGYTNQKKLFDFLKDFKSDEIITPEKLLNIPINEENKFFLNHMIICLKSFNQDDYFYKLLCFFPSSLIYELNVNQKRYLLTLLKKFPYVFCFRNLLQRLICLYNGSPFKKDFKKLKLFDIDLNYASIRMDLIKKGIFGTRESMLYRKEDQNKQQNIPFKLKFKPNIPLLTYDQVSFLLSKEGKEECQHLFQNIQTSNKQDEEEEEQEEEEKEEEEKEEEEKIDFQIFHKALEYFLKVEALKKGLGVTVVKLSCENEIREIRNKQMETIIPKKNSSTSPPIDRPYIINTNAYEDPEDVNNKLVTLSKVVNNKYTVEENADDIEQENLKIEELKEIEINKAKQLHKKTIEFLLNEKILVEYKKTTTTATVNSEQNDFGFFMLYEDNLLEESFVDFMHFFCTNKDGIIDINILNNCFYSQEYFVLLKNWVIESFFEDTSSLFLRTSGKNWSNYIKANYDILFVPIDTKELHFQYFYKKNIELQKIKKQRKKNKYTKNTKSNNNNNTNTQQQEHVFTVIFEKSQKMAMEDILYELWTIILHIHEKRNIELYEIRLRVYFIGCLDDLPIYNAIGARNIFSDLAQIIGYKDFFEEEIRKKTDPEVLKIKNIIDRKLDLNTNGNVHIQDSFDKITKKILKTIRTNHKQELDIKNEKKKQEKKKKKQEKNKKNINNNNNDNNNSETKLTENQEQELKTSITNTGEDQDSQLSRKTKIFCSKKEDHRLLSEKLDIPKERIYNQNHFYVGDIVCVPTTGTYGSIKKIFQTKADDTQQELSTKDCAELKYGTFFFAICPCTLTSRCKCNDIYPSNLFNINHCYIEMIQRYNGIPFENVIFYVSKNTTIEEIKAALTYCTKSIEFFLMEENKKHFSELVNKGKRFLRDTSIGDKFVKFQE